MKKALLGVLGAALLLAAYYAYAPRHAPEGQPPLALVTAQSLPAVEKAFNDAADQTRLLVLLSPT